MDNNWITHQVFNGLDETPTALMDTVRQATKEHVDSIGNGNTNRWILNPYYDRVRSLESGMALLYNPRVLEEYL
jgi:hypothetical protein